jgi:hypothetical protein
VSNQAEAEIARLNFQKQRSKAPASEKASSVLLEGSKAMPLEKLLAKLENMRANAKEDVKMARMRVREECDADEKYVFCSIAVPSFLVVISLSLYLSYPCIAACLSAFSDTT